MAEPETRNSIEEIPLEPAEYRGSSHRVGGRHKGTPTTLGGGGYLDNCTDFKNRVALARRADPRLHELRKFGLNSRWMIVASVIGFDEFMALWQVLDEIERARRAREKSVTIRFRLPRFKHYLRHQRNLWLHHLATEQNLTLKAIQNMLKRETGEELSIFHIKRIINAQDQANDDG